MIALHALSASVPLIPIMKTLSWELWSKGIQLYTEDGLFPRGGAPGCPGPAPREVLCAFFRQVKPPQGTP